MNKSLEPMIVQENVFSIQVCVPEDYSDGEIKKFADAKNPAGTTNGWFIRTSDPDPIKVNCSERPGFVHLVLEC